MSSSQTPTTYIKLSNSLLTLASYNHLAFHDTTEQLNLGHVDNGRTLLMNLVTYLTCHTKDLGDAFSFLPNFINWILKSIGSVS